MNNWGRTTFDTQYKHQITKTNNNINTQNNYNPRCSYGNQKLTFPTSPKKDIIYKQNQYESPNKTCRPTAHYQIKSVAELKASGETANTMTNSGAQQSLYDVETKSHSKIDEIGSLLSDFKSKFASIQQKYSLKPKQPQISNASKYQPITPQCLPATSKFDYSANKRFLEPETSQYSKTPTYTINSKNTFTTADEHQDFLGEKPKVIQTKQIKFDLPMTCVIEKAIEKKVADKAKFRATFSPTQTKAFQTPIRKIRQAQQVIVKSNKFTNCKNVESESEQNEDEDHNLKESVVISKFDSDWKKLRRTQTLNQNHQNKTSEGNLDILKRFKSFHHPSDR